MGTRLRLGFACLITTVLLGCPGGDNPCGLIPEDGGETLVPDDGDLAPVVWEFVFLGDSTVLLYNEDDEFVRSEDEGRTWAVVSKAGITPEGYERRFWALNAGEDQRVWARWCELVPEDWVFPDHVDDYIPPTGGVAVSNDGGATFQLIERGDLPEFQPSGFICPVPGSAPLFSADISGQLWSYIPSSGSAAASFTPWGSPVPVGDVVAGVHCSNRIVVGVDEGFGRGGILVSAFWSSTDDGQTWSRDYEDFPGGAPFHMVCGPTDDLWSIPGNHILWFDPAEERWISVSSVASLSYYFDVAADVEDTTSDGSRLFVLCDRGSVFSVAPNGDLEQLPTLPTTYATAIAARQRKDTELWAAGRGLFRLDARTQTWEQVWPE